MSYTITIVGVPTPWKAPKLGKYGAYAPHHNAKEAIRLQVKGQWKDEPIDEAVYCDFTFYMPIPKSISTKERIKMVSGYVFHEKRPDRTNLLKLYEDCLNGIVVKDDCKIVTGPVTKLYGETPKTVIKIIKVSDLIVDTQNYGTTQ